MARQQRGVDVQDPAVVAAHEPGAQDTHEACKHQQVGLPLAELVRDGAIEIEIGRNTVQFAAGETLTQTAVWLVASMTQRPLAYDAELLST